MLSELRADGDSCGPAGLWSGGAAPGDFCVACAAPINAALTLARAQYARPSHGTAVRESSLVPCSLLLAPSKEAHRPVPRLGPCSVTLPFGSGT